MWRHLKVFFSRLPAATSLKRKSGCFLKLPETVRTIIAPNVYSYKFSQHECSCQVATQEKDLQRTGHKKNVCVLEKQRCNALGCGRTDIEHLKTYCFGHNAENEENEIHFSFPS
jgi:hypothetical protein